MAECMLQVHVYDETTTSHDLYENVVFVLIFFDLGLIQGPSRHRKSLTPVPCIVFDEESHGYDQNPYNRVMEFYYPTLPGGGTRRLPRYDLEVKKSHSPGLTPCFYVVV